MNVSLTPQLEAMVREQVASGRYNNASEVVRDALRQLEQREAQLQRLRVLIQEGEDSGEPIELTDELWDEIDREADEIAARGAPSEPRLAAAGR